MINAISLELARDFKDKGFFQDTEWVWEDFPQGRIYPTINPCTLPVSLEEMEARKVIACPTLDELFDRMGGIQILSWFDGREYHCQDIDEKIVFTAKENLVTAVTKLFIYKNTPKKYEPR